MQGQQSGAAFDVACMSLLDRFLSEENNMIPIKQHIEMLEKFQNKLDELENGLKIMKSGGIAEKEKFAFVALSSKWFDGLQIWIEIDDFIECKILPFVDKNI